MSLIDNLIESGNTFVDCNKKQYSRFKAWEFCYNKFNDDKITDTDELSLHLSLYLANWGMYRKSFLLQKNYTINYDIVKIIKKFQSEHKDDIKITNKSQLEKLLQKDSFFSDVENLGNEIEEKYKEKGIDNKNVTDTLKTKIIMGPLGITPAYDRNFNKAADDIKKEGNHIVKKFNAKSLKIWYQFYNDHFDAFEELRKATNYPIMKVLDMCLWQYKISMLDRIDYLPNIP